MIICKQCERVAGFECVCLEEDIAKSRVADLLNGAIKVGDVVHWNHRTWSTKKYFPSRGIVRKIYYKSIDSKRFMVAQIEPDKNEYYSRIRNSVVSIMVNKLSPSNTQIGLARE